MKLNINLKYLSVSIIFVVCIMAIVIFYTKNNREQSYSSTMFSMDTIVSVQTYGSDLTSEVQSKVEELNDIFDRHSIDTPLYILNKDKTLKNPSIYLNDLVTKTLELNDEFGSNVDISSGTLIDTWNINSDTPRVPTDNEISIAMATIGSDNISIKDSSISLLNGCTLDVGSVAKGYTLDVIYNLIKDADLDSACVSMGSSTLLLNVQNYNVGVRSPTDNNSLACTFTVNGTGYISTSGGYERYMEIDGQKYSHILDLSTGYPTTTDLTSVTVYTNSGIKSDFLSTYIYLGGTKDIYKYLNADDYKVIAIDTNHNLYISKNFDIKIKDNSLKLYNYR